MNITHYPQAVIEADPIVPLIRMTRDFAATPAQGYAKLDAILAAGDDA